MLQMSESINEILGALVEIQNELPTLPKNAKAYGYKYTDLDTIVSTIRPILHKYGVAYMQSVGGGINGGELVLTTRIFSKSGQYIEDTVALPEINGEKTKTNAAQTIGMSITYMRRYMICTMLGITSDEDVDANDFARQQQQNTPAPQPPQKSETIYADGKPATAAEKARLHELCAAKYLNGQNIFSKDEMSAYLAMSKEKTAAQLIALIEGYLRNRRADAPELPENRGR